MPSAIRSRVGDFDLEALSASAMASSESTPMPSEGMRAISSICAQAAGLASALSQAGSAGLGNIVAGNNATVAPPAQRISDMNSSGLAGLGQSMNALAGSSGTGAATGTGSTGASGASTSDAPADAPAADRPAAETPVASAEEPSSSTSTSEPTSTETASTETASTETETPTEEAPAHRRRRRPPHVASAPPPDAPDPEAPPPPPDPPAHEEPPPPSLDEAHRSPPPPFERFPTELSPEDEPGVEEWIEAARESATDH